MNMNSERPHEYLQKSTFWLAISCILILTPFCVNNFLQGRTLLGAGSMLIVIIVSINAWLIRQKRYHHQITLFSLIPVVIFFLVIAIRKQGIIGVLWCYPSVISFYMMLPERKAWLANIALLIKAIPIAWYIVDTPLAARMIATLMAVSIFSAIFTHVIAQQQSELHETAITDQLTGLLNRALLQSNLEQSIQYNNRSGEPMTILILDLDHFKDVNDTYGHDTGDIALKRFAEVLKERFRGTDKVFRLGGEEFLVLLYATNSVQSANIAEELRNEVSTLKLIPNKSITVSIGVAGLRPSESWTTWMKRCDENLYRAKAEGRNRVVA